MSERNGTRQRVNLSGLDLPQEVHPMQLSKNPFEEANKLDEKMRLARWEHIHRMDELQRRREEKAQELLASFTAMGMQMMSGEAAEALEKMTQYGLERGVDGVTYIVEGTFWDE